MTGLTEAYWQDYILHGTTTLPAPESAPQLVISPQQPASWVPPAPRTELIWAAVDLDGTLSEGVWTPSSSGREIGAPIMRNVRKLDILIEAGYKIVIHTARGWEHYEAIESWLDHYGLPYDRIVCGKLLAAVYVDDRAVESEAPQWTPAAQRGRQELHRMMTAYGAPLSLEEIPRPRKFPPGF